MSLIAVDEYQPDELDGFIEFDGLVYLDDGDRVAGYVVEDDDYDDYSDLYYPDSDPWLELDG